MFDYHFRVQKVTKINEIFFMYFESVKPNNFFIDIYNINLSKNS